MCKYVDQLRNSRRRVVKPAKVGVPTIRHTPKAHNATIPATDWRFETTPQRPHGIYEDGTVEILK